ncbi:MAG: membrane protein insertion efficiency factor YidD [candidate division WOR-3 bacterium]|nr:MAG: membrane protein insertion efficiency factor YidD [candidate division WOR-3 bacterium]
MSAALASAGYDALAVSGSWLIDGYKAVLSPLQGRRMCNFWPTCSRFTREAIQSQGLLPGVVIGADRLLRCNPWAWNLLDQHYRGISQDRLNDPVGNHIAWDPPGEPAGLTVLALQPEDAVADRPAPGRSAASLPFADHLYANQDFARAATEYLRVYLTPSTLPRTRDYATLMAGESFLRSGEFGRARLAFAQADRGQTAGLALYGNARAWFAEAGYENARSALDKIKNGELATRRTALQGWSYLKEYRFRRAADVFAEDDALARLADMDPGKLSARSRALSTVMSAVIPGSGQAYSGRVGDGIYSFLTVAATGLAFYWFAANHEKDSSYVKTSLFGVLTALFHAGNVYGANIAARDYNSLQRRRYLERAEDILRTISLEPDYSSVSGSRTAPATPTTGVQD